MRQFRRLCFECMEPRIPMAMHAFGSSPEIKASELARLLETNDAGSILRALVQQADPSAGMHDTASPITPIAKSQSHDREVRLSVLLADDDRQIINEFNPNQVYLASVFVEDLRVDALHAGGVFQAFVDVEFSQNIMPVGDFTFGPAFNAERGEGSIESARLTGVGSMATDFKPTQQASHLLFEIPFVISGSNSPTFIRVTPSASTPEPVLLFNRNESIPNDAIVPASVTLPIFNSTNLTGQDFFPTPIAVPPSTPPARVSRGLEVAYAHVIFVSNDADRYASNFVNRWSQDRAVPEGMIDWQRRLRETEQEEDFRELNFPEEALLDLFEEPMPRLDADTNESEDDSEDDAESALFYDERLFLEGSLISPWTSPFRLHFRIFPLDAESENTKKVSAQAQQSPSPADGLVDIAAILRPSQPVAAVAKRSDAAIVELTSPLEENSEVNLAQPIFFDVPSTRSHPKTTPVEKPADVAWSIDHHPRLDLNRQRIGDP